MLTSNEAFLSFCFCSWFQYQQGLLIKLKLVIIWLDYWNVWAVRAYINERSVGKPMKHGNTAKHSAICQDLQTLWPS